MNPQKKTFEQLIEEQAPAFGSMPFWSWNDRLKPDELKSQIRNMHDRNMQGFFMHARMGLETDYLSEDWFGCVKACVEEAEKLGMEAWLYDENGWPSGFAGGELLDDPENYAAYLTVSKGDKEDGAALCSYAGEDGIYNIYIKICSSYVDVMNPEVTDKFIAATHEKYKEMLGDRLGTTAPGFFTDEPQYYRWDAPWSNTFLEAFKKEYGYDVRKAVPALFFDFEGADEMRYDYYRLCNMAYTENYAARVYDWCQKHNCKLTGHTIEETTLAAQMWCTGGVMPFYMYEHIPGIDHLCRGIDGDDLSPKQVASVAAQTGRKRVLTESFAACGWDVSPKELRNIAEWQYVSGVNLLCHHLYPYSIRGQRKYDYPAFYSEHLPWQEALGDFNLYLNRVGAATSEGAERLEALVLHPMHSCWLKYKRLEDAGSVAELQESITGLIRTLGNWGVQYHLGDEFVMKELGSVKEGRLIIGKCSYDTVILPLLYTIDSSTAGLLKMAQDINITNPQS